MPGDKCWICDFPGDSREHLLKASDIRGLFGDVSPSNRLVIRNDKGERVKVIQSAKSKSLKQ